MCTGYWHWIHFSAVKTGGWILVEDWLFLASERVWWHRTALPLCTHVISMSFEPSHLLELPTSTFVMKADVIAKASLHYIVQS